MRILFVGALYHPEELIKYRQNNPLEAKSEFPPAQAEFFYVRSLRKLGHQVEVFIRNMPVLFGLRARHSQHFRTTRNVAMLINAVAHRVPRLYPDYWIRNQHLLAQAKRFEPDVVLLMGGERVIYPETLEQLKILGCKLVYMNGDSPILFASNLERTSAPLYDLVLVNDYYHGIQWLDLGSPHMEVLPLSGCDPEYHRSYPLSDKERVEYGCDVGFVGTLLPPLLYSQRAAALEAIQDYGLGVWSIHDVPASLRPNYRGAALGEKTFRAICGSKIQLNPNSNFMYYGGNMRLFEVPACGIFQITNETPGAKEWFTAGETIVMYRDLSHLRQLVEYYQKHDDERQQIAQAAQEHVYRHHTYDHRMARLLELAKADSTRRKRLEPRRL